MNCCDDYGECTQGHGCACHETPLHDEKHEVSLAWLGFLACCLSAAVMVALIIWGVTE